MKFTKLSLAALAAMAFAGSAFAVENVKVDGQIKLWYQTEDVSGSGVKMFDSKAAQGDLAATVGVSGDLTKKVGFGLKFAGETTLGLENNLVGGVQNTAAVGTEANPYILSEAFFTYKAGNTIAKIGRQALATPLAYSETWGAVENTFEAAVLINKDLPNTTLIAAYVGKGNGDSGVASSAFNSFGGAVGKTVLGLGGGNLGSLAASNSGAYAVAMVNNSIPGLTIHPVYYDVIDVATAFWADATLTAVPVVKVEAQYANMDPSKVLGAGLKSTSGYAGKVSASVADINLAGSYSSIDKGALSIGNTATGFATTKIFTAGAGGSTTGKAAGWSDTTGYKVEASTKLAGVGLSAYYNSIEVGKDSNNAKAGATSKATLSSAALIADVKIDEIDVHAAYISESNDKNKSGMADQGIVRVVASIKF